jgi:hypothetical protein
MRKSGASGVVVFFATFELDLAGAFAAGLVGLGRKFPERLLPDHRGRCWRG